jgi:hypothetical protein
VDSKAKTDGSARFTLDVYLPDMLNGRDRAAAAFRSDGEIDRQGGDASRCRA